MIEYIITGGGRGSKMLGDTMFLEIKQVPHAVVEETDRLLLRSARWIDNTHKKSCKQRRNDSNEHF